MKTNYSRTAENRKSSTDSNHLDLIQEQTTNLLGLKTIPKNQRESDNQLLGKKTQQPNLIIQEKQEHVGSIKSNSDFQEGSNENSESQYKISSQIQEQPSEFSGDSQNKSGNRNAARKNKKKKNIPRSAHHNSQKHAVVTIKTMIEFPFSGTESRAHQVAKKLWEKFQQSKRKNKGMLNVLFGIKDDDEKELQQLLTQYNFREILPYTYTQIKQAQGILREMIINQVNSETLSKNLKFRRIQNKKQFREYMINLVNQLKDGPLRRRILKEASSKITEFAEFDKYLNQESFYDLQF